jgi:hypothetical protein
MEQPLSGGNLTAVVRIGDTVRRAPGSWTAGVHALLAHLEQRGFPYAPRVRGFDDAGREILTYIDGEAGFYDRQCVSPAYLWSDQVVVEAARALRTLHDATLDFASSVDASWQVVFPDARQHEVMCHNDVAPYNCVFRDGHFAGFIDFDTVGPGPRLWDVVYAAYRFVPLVPKEALPEMGLDPETQAGSRLRLLCDAYGLEDRTRFVDMLLQRIDAIGTMLTDGARRGIAGYQQVLAEGGHLERLGRDKAFVQQNRAQLERWLTDTSQ